MSFRLMWKRQTTEMKRAEQTLDSTDLYAEQESRDLQLSQVSGLWFQDCVVSALCGFSTVWLLTEGDIAMMMMSSEHSSPPPTSQQPLRKSKQTTHTQTWGHLHQKNVPCWAWAGHRIMNTRLSKDRCKPHLALLWGRVECNSHSTACHLSPASMAHMWCTWAWGSNDIKLLGLVF